MVDGPEGGEESCCIRYTSQSEERMMAPETRTAGKGAVRREVGSGARGTARVWHVGVEGVLFAAHCGVVCLGGGAWRRVQQQSAEVAAAAPRMHCRPVCGAGEGARVSGAAGQGRGGASAGSASGERRPSWTPCKVQFQTVGTASLNN